MKKRKILKTDIRKSDPNHNVEKTSQEIA